MAYRASTYRPGTEDEPNAPTSRRVRERSPRRNGRRSPGYEQSAGQGPRRLERTENRSRSPGRSSPLSGSLCRMSGSEKRRREYENTDREHRPKQALDWKKDISENFTERRQPDFQPKDTSDQESDKVQGLQRALIGIYADEFIRDSWQGGAKVTKESSARFAAEVLLYVRKKFYSGAAKKEAGARAAGNEPKRDPPNGPDCQKLILENMKWVCDTKIKPHTDQYTKELFLCNGCEYKNRLYTFESLLQHYASKHTSALSRGTVVVHWKAEWPENPPFHPEPDMAMDPSLLVALFNASSSNETLTSPRGIFGYAENKEFEKMKRDVEIREREIAIKAAKEEIERKEQEKARKECESKERQARAAGAAGTADAMERKNRVPEDQASVLEKSVGDKQSAGGGTSSLQLNDPFALQAGIDNITHTDSATRKENQERSTLSQLQISDPKSRPWWSINRSVETSNMDSNLSDSRITQRRHLAGLFTQFMAEVSEQTALQLRRDSAKKILEQKTAAYQKAQIMQKEFPSAEESTKASKERAQKELQNCEQKLIQKRGESAKLSEDISEIVYPEEDSSDNERNVVAKIKNLEDKLAQYQADSELVKNKQEQLDQVYRTLMTDKDRQMITESIGEGFSSVREDVSAFVAKLSTFETEMTQLKQTQAPTSVISSFEGLTLRIHRLEQQKPSDEIQELRSIMGGLSSKVDVLETVKLELNREVNTIKSTLALHSAVVNDRSEMETVHSSIKALERSDVEIRAGFAKLQNQMQTLGKDLRSMKMVEKGRHPSDASIRDTGLSNDLRIAIHDEIRAQQEAVDIVLDQKFEDLEAQLENLKGHLKPLEAQFGEFDASLNSFRNQYATKIDRVAIDLGSMRGDINNSTREEINALKQNDIHSLQLAYRNLDYRMNNLSTEELARHILGQLDAHIRGSEKSVTSLELRLQELERRAANGEGSPISRRDVEESLSIIRKELIDGVDERLDRVKSVLIDLNNDLVRDQMKLRAEVDTNLSKWQSVKADIGASKTNMSEATGSLTTEVDKIGSKAKTIEADLSASKMHFAETTKSLRAEVDSIGLTLQAVQDDLGATRNSCKEATASLKLEITKGTKTNALDKRKIESPGLNKTNGHKRKKAKGSISDSDDDA